MVLSMVVPKIIPQMMQFKKLYQHQIEVDSLSSGNLSSIQPALRHLIDFITVQHQVGCESIMLVKKDVLVLNGQKLVQGMQVHKKLMLKIMSKSIAARLILPENFISQSGINKRTIIGWERDGRYPRSIEMLEKMADIFHVPLTYLQPDQSLFIERAAEAYGKKGKIEAQHLAFELTELFASGELTPQDMDGIMYEMHKAYFKYREQKREKERIMNL